jgi:hypothetical protein
MVPICIHVDEERLSVKIFHVNNPYSEPTIMKNRFGTDPSFRSDTKTVANPVDIAPIHSKNSNSDGNP